jgi:hypothetical protein
MVPTDTTGETIYRAPRGFVGVFYAALAAWTVGLVPLALSKALATSTTLLLMIAFFTAYSWYWSLGISYRMTLGEDGSLCFVSAKACLRAHVRDVEQVEGPPLPISIGFIRFRLERERPYIFFREDPAIRDILRYLRRANPDAKFKRLSPRLFQPR